MGSNSVKRTFKNIVKSLKKIKETTVVFTLPNVDKGSDEIIKILKEISKKNKKKYKIFKSMGDDLYLSTIKHSDLVLGNSSSGIIEVPFFKIPTLNIGDRQLGRVQPKSIINSKSDYKSIFKNIKIAFSKKKKVDFKILTIMEIQAKKYLKS